MEKKLFLVGIMASIVIHLLFFGIIPIPFSLKKIPPEPVQPLEVTYTPSSPRSELSKPKKSEPVGVVDKHKTPSDQDVEVLSKKGNPFSSLKKAIESMRGSSSKHRGTMKSKEMIAPEIDRKISLPPLSTEKISNPQFITYNEGMRDTIRLNIKRKIYSYVNHPDFETGEVYLTFVLNSNGILKRVKIIDDKTFANSYLREIALRSVRESSPFPKFPEGFDYPEFTFNLLISFQN